MCVPNLEGVCTTHTLQTIVHFPTWASECTRSMRRWNGPPKGSRRECTRYLRAHSRLDSQGSKQWHCKQPSTTDRLQTMALAWASMISHPLPSVPRLPRAVVDRGGNTTSTDCKVVDRRVLRLLVDGERPCTTLRAHCKSVLARTHALARAAARRHRIGDRVRRANRSRNEFRSERATTTGEAMVMAACSKLREHGTRNSPGNLVGRAL